jgi:hypothetical protein
MRSTGRSYVTKRQRIDAVARSLEQQCILLADLVDAHDSSFPSSHSLSQTFPFPNCPPTVRGDDGGGCVEPLYLVSICTFALVKQVNWVVNWVQVTICVPRTSNRCSVCSVCGSECERQSSAEQRRPQHLGRIRRSFQLLVSWCGHWRSAQSPPELRWPLEPPVSRHQKIWSLSRSCVYVCVSVCLCVCVCVCVCLCLYLWMYVCMYVYTCACVCVCVCVYFQGMAWKGDMPLVYWSFRLQKNGAARGDIGHVWIRDV